MENITNIKTSIFAVLAVLGGLISRLLGGWDMSTQTLVLFMAIDYTTGLVVAGVFKKSKKTETGALESRAGFKGIIKKFVTLMVVMMGSQLDLLLEMDYIRNGLVIAFIVDEGMSIIENIGLMGMPMPELLTKAFDMLREDKKKRK